MKNIVQNTHILKSFDLVELPFQDCSEVRLPSYEKLFPASWAGDAVVRRGIKMPSRRLLTGLKMRMDCIRLYIFIFL